MTSPRRGGSVRVALVALAVLAGLVAVGLITGRSGTPAADPGSASTGCVVVSSQVPGASASKLPVQPLCALPPEAATVYAQIRSGGPYRYDRDGVVFANAERLLPAEPRGYYHEFTVPTPGETDRGARRLVTGAGQELYYTGDHYGSFVVVDGAATGG
ncbi:ribonuclease domain-containing protein [Pseudonocardia benzenivorans]|uniref:Ribonuclease domain-containing protein n=1 Tax=Pseudonocardia benzenivorans TaxID=228005 RepID=A0ABW3VR87_9PSEU